MRTSFWQKERDLDLDQREPMGIMKNVSVEMKKRNLSDVLELGCGRGRNCIWLAREHFSVTGIDYNLRDLILLKDYVSLHGIPLNIVQNDVSALSFRKDAFDVVLSLHVLTYVREEMRTKVVGEVKRVLRPQGLFVAVERSPKDPLYRKGSEIEKETYLLDGIAHHFFSAQEIQTLLEPMEIAVIKESRTFDTSHDHLHIHGMWLVVAVNT